MIKVLLLAILISTSIAGASDQDALALVGTILSQQQDYVFKSLARSQIIPILLSDDLRHKELPESNDPLLKWKLIFEPILKISVNGREITADPSAPTDKSTLWKLWGKILAQTGDWDRNQQLINNGVEEVNSEQSSPQKSPQVFSKQLIGGEEIKIAIVDGYEDNEDSDIRVWTNDIFVSKASSALFQYALNLDLVDGNENELVGIFGSQKLHIYFRHSGIPGPWDQKRQLLQSAQAYGLFTWGMADADVIVYNGHSRNGRFLDFGARDDQINPFKFHIGSLFANLPFIFYPDISRMNFRVEKPQALIHLGCDSEILLKKRLKKIADQYNEGTQIYTLPDDVQEWAGPIMELLYTYGVLRGADPAALKNAVLDTQTKGKKPFYLDLIYGIKK